MTQLTLGTAQFGLEYGINNKTGKPKKEVCFEMLGFAYKKGVRYFDTAYAYGDAEKLLGEFIKKNNLSSEIKVISKIKPYIFYKHSKNVERLVENQIVCSLRKLKINSLEGYLFHNPEYIYNKDAVGALKKCKKMGLIKNYGTTIYDVKDALYAVKLPVDFIQIPYSVFDQRLNKTDFFKIAKKNKVKVSARSAFVQGLIFMNHDEIPDKYTTAKAYLNKFDCIIKKYGYTRLEASLLFSYKNPGIDYVVFGVDNIDQLSQIIDVVKKGKRYTRFKRCSVELKNAFGNITRSIVMPKPSKKPK